MNAPSHGASRGPWRTKALSFVRPRKDASKTVGDWKTEYDNTIKALAGVSVKMVVAILSGCEPEINDTSTYDNGVKVVPSYLLEPVSVDVTNYEEVLVGSGYYTADQLK